MKYTGLYNGEGFYNARQLLDMGALPGIAGYISFTRYNDEIVKSTRFSGCYMAAFHFKRIPLPQEHVNIEGIDRVETNTPYIAHIYTYDSTFDTKYQFARLYNKGIIGIEALIQPYSRSYQQERNRIYGRLHEQGRINSDLYSVGYMVKTAAGKWSFARDYQYIDNNNNPQDYDGTDMKQYYSEQELMRLTYYNLGVIGVVYIDDIPEQFLADYQRGFQEYEERTRRNHH